MSYVYCIGFTPPKVKSPCHHIFNLLYLIYLPLPAFHRSPVSESHVIFLMGGADLGHSRRTWEMLPAQLRTTAIKRVPQ